MALDVQSLLIAPHNCLNALTSTLRRSLNCFPSILIPPSSDYSQLSDRNDSCVRPELASSLVSLFSHSVFLSCSAETPRGYVKCESQTDVL